MKPGVAFDVCHEVYATAREIVHSRMATLQMDRASKFLWRPDLRPRLVEYVADFARAGERALGESVPGPVPKNWGCRAPQRPATAGACGAKKSDHAAFGAKRFPRASRLILFRMYYLGGAEYRAARRVLGISERTWSDWAEEIRLRVGDELIRAGMYPPARYFKQASEPAARPVPASTNDAQAEKIGSGAYEPDFA